LEWDYVPCTFNFKVWLKDVTTRTTLYKGVPASDYKLTPMLTKGHKYKWWLKACNFFGCGERTVKWTFTLRPKR
jgi:hypothetical protein